MDRATPIARRSESRASEVRDLLALLVKTLKALRLYREGNAITERLEAELAARLEDALAAHGPLELVVRELAILYDDEPVYESEDRNDSLAFLLYRDGIRRVGLRPGLDRAELRQLLDCLRRVGLHGNEQDDLVTLFWEQDFRSIDYFAVEELGDETVEGPRLEEQLRSGRLEGAGPTEVVRLDDLEQPVAALPVEACRLTPEELGAIRAELDTLEDEPFGIALVELCVDLARLEDDEAERRRIGESLVAVVDRMLEEGRLVEVADTLEHAGGLAAMALRDEPAADALRARLADALVEPRRLGRLLELVEKTGTLRPARLAALLVELGPRALPTIVSALGRVPSAAYRRALAEAVRAAGPAGLDELARHVPAPGEGPTAPELLREVHYIAASARFDAARPLVERLLAADEPAVRREGAALLGRYDAAEAARRAVDALDDPDPEVRANALDAVVRRGDAALGRSLLDRAAASETVAAASLAEKRRIFAAVAKLAGEEALDGLAALVRPTGLGWFVLRKERALRRAAVHGIRIVGTPRARRLLEELARSRDRDLRAAAAAELEELEP